MLYFIEAMVITIGLMIVYIIIEDLLFPELNLIKSMMDSIKNRFKKKFGRKKRTKMDIHEKRCAGKMNVVDVKGNTRVVYGDWILNSEGQKINFREW